MYYKIREFVTRTVWQHQDVSRRNQAVFKMKTYSNVHVSESVLAEITLLSVFGYIIQFYLQIYLLCPWI